MRIALAVALLVAAIARPAAADGDDAPLVTDGDVSEARVHGLRILVKRTPGVELVATELYLRGGATDWSEADAGIEQLALATAVGGGSTTVDKLALGRRLADLGATLGAVAGEDWSRVEAKALASGWEDAFALLVDVLLHPALPSSEIEVQRQQQLAAIHHLDEEPEARVDELARAVWFAGHPYRNAAIGTVASVSALDETRLRVHLAGLAQTSRMLLVVVGDVAPARVVERTRAAFAGVPRGAWREPTVTTPSFARPSLRVEKRRLPTTYVTATFGAPGWRDPDFAAGLVAAALLDFRLFDEVRSKRNLSYAPGAALHAFSLSPRGELSVSSTSPAQAVRVMEDEVRRLQRDLASSDEISGTASEYLTGRLLDAESSDGQAQLLAEAALLAGDWRRARTLPDEIRRVSATDVREFARKHLRALQAVVLGAGKGLDARLFAD